MRGLVHLGCGDYVMAHRCWWTCLSVPAEASSAIMVAAWKKLALVQPLLDRSRDVSNVYYNLGNSQGTTHNVTTRYPKSMSKAMSRLLTSGKDTRDESVMLYTQLGPAAEMCKHDLVQTLISNHETLLKNDGNYGMAQLCLKRVWEATQLFSTVSVAQLAQRWAIAPEEIPQRLIDSKVPCRMEDDGMVVFAVEKGSNSTANNQGLPPPANASDPSFWIDLSEWMQLLERLQHLEMSISTSSKYHTLKKDDKSGGSSGGEAMMGPRGVEDF
ncbi:MAG: hypothetical protein SGARI_002001 [Bacillariaceae sp.]